MNNNVDVTKTNKTADKTTYMREYKRKQYQEDAEKMRELNKAYYYKNKFDVSVEDMRKYKTLLPYVVRIRKDLDEIKRRKPELIEELVEPYLI